MKGHIGIPLVEYALIKVIQFLSLGNAFRENKSWRGFFGLY